MLPASKKSFFIPIPRKWLLAGLGAIVAIAGVCCFLCSGGDECTAQDGTVTPGTVTPGTATPGTATPGAATSNAATSNAATSGTTSSGTVTSGAVGTNSGTVGRLAISDMNCPCVVTIIKQEPQQNGTHNITLNFQPRSGVTINSIKLNGTTVRGSEITLTGVSPTSPPLHLDVNYDNNRPYTITFELK